MSDKPDSPLMPEVTFSTFVLSLASSALMHLGEVPDPETGRTVRNEALARNAIDLLTMLDDKTRNGLSAEESKLMRDILYELRMKFVAHA
ncbi:DUF1844 domain-containing protein [Mailhella sp.]|uniref:DUF1844 domain-containing protein n=1 Tax=Mailhella sp. TaxID=1981029 RepID=UPI004063BB52